MNKEEIIDLLKKKEAEYIEASKENHSNNTEVLSNYNYGVAVGLRMAISMVGMLDKSNTTAHINFDFKKFSEFIDEKLKEDFSYIPLEDLSNLAKLAYIHFKRDISIHFCDEEDYLSKKFRDISRNDISTIIELIYDYVVNEI